MSKDENQQDKQDIFLSSLKKSLIYFCIVSIICIVLFLVFVIFFNEPISDWGAYGDYIGGVIGTIFAIAAFIGTLIMIHIQQKELTETKKEFKKQSAIFNQQQFEETFFSLIKLLDEKQLVPTEKNNENKDYHIVYGLIKEIIAMIKNYQNECMPEEEKEDMSKEEKEDMSKEEKEDMSKEEKKHIKNEIYHYINILKLQVKDETHLYLLDRIMGYNEIELKKYFKQNHFCEFMDIEIIIKDIEKYEKYFGKDIFGDNKDFLRRKSEYTGLEAEEYQKLYRPDGKNIAKDIAILKNLSKNMAPKMPENILIELAQNHQQELTEEDKKEIRQNVANNRNAPAKALEILSTDNEENIRKAVAANQNTPEKVLNELATNDKSNEVRISALGNSHISAQILDKELQNKYNKINDENINEIVYIIFNNSQLYDDNTKFNQYAIKIIEHLEDASYNIKQILSEYFNQKKYENIFVKFVILSIDNILNSKYQFICYNILDYTRNDNKTIFSNIQLIINNSFVEIGKFTIQAFIEQTPKDKHKAQITSVFKKYETELREFISQLETSKN